MAPLLSLRLFLFRQIALLAWQRCKTCLEASEGVAYQWQSSRKSLKIFSKNLENLWRNQIYSRGDQSPVTQKVQLASIFFLGLQAYSFDFRSCTLSLEEFLKVSCGYPGSSMKCLALLFWHFFARKCNTCDHLNCYNLPLNMHQVFDLSKRHLPNISCCFIYHLICL